VAPAGLQEDPPLPISSLTRLVVLDLYCSGLHDEEEKQIRILGFDDLIYGILQ